MIFLSYARRDSAAIARLNADLERLDPWFDSEISGGADWWNTILAKIRESEMFIFLVSRYSVDSRACQAELDYAVQTRRRILPISVDDVPLELVPPSIARRDVIELKQDGRDNLTEVQGALLDLPYEDVPSPPPTPPGIPFTDLSKIRRLLSAEGLSPVEQQNVVTELRRHAGDVDLQPAVLELGRMFLGRRGLDLVSQVEDQLNELVEKVSRSNLTDAEKAARDDIIQKVVSQLNDVGRTNVTPIVGSGLTDSLVGTRPEAARWLADEAQFPFSSFRRNDLAVVAQFVKVMRGRRHLISTLETYLLQRLGATIGDGEASGRAVADALENAWEQRSSETVSDAHAVLAGLPCRIYVNAHPWGLLRSALIAAGKEPVTEVCRWKRNRRSWPESIYASEPDYEPTIERPLVYHLFGTLEHPETLVLTEDDHLEFMMGVTRDASSLMMPVRTALADSALLFLGFDLDELAIRVLLALVEGQEGAHRLDDYEHVAAQVDPPSGARLRQRMQEFLQKYVRNNSSPPKIDIYWGTVEEFCAELAAARESG